MQNFFISDPHLGHKNIPYFRDFVASTEHNTSLITEHWNRIVPKKRAVVHCLGDMAFDVESNELIKSLNGTKILYKGNHDDEISTEHHAATYEEIYGLRKHFGLWLSHAPIHESELRGKVNVHGHIHNLTIDSPHYFNVCVDNLMAVFGVPIISLDQLRGWIDKTKYLWSL